MLTPPHYEHSPSQPIDPQEVGAVAVAAVVEDVPATALYLDGQLLSDTTRDSVKELRALYKDVQAEEIEVDWEYRNRISDILGSFVMEAANVSKPGSSAQLLPTKQVIEPLAPDDHFAGMEQDDHDLQLRLRLLRHVYGSNERAIVTALIESDCEREVAGHLDQLKPAARRTAVELLIDGNNSEYVANNLDKLKPAEQRTAVDGLFEAGEAWSIGENLGKLKPRYRLEVALQMIDDDWGEYVTENLDAFTTKTQGKLIGIMLDSRDGDSLAIQLAGNAKNIDPVYHQSVAEALVNDGHFYHLNRALPNLRITNQTELALQSIREDHTGTLLEIMQHCKDVDKDAVIDLLIEQEEFNFLVNNFQGLGLRPATVLKRLTDADAYQYIARNLGYFKKCKDSTGVRLIEMGWENRVAEHIGVFTNKRRIAEALIKREAGNEVLENFADFGIPATDEFVMRCIEAGGLEEFLENIDDFKKIDKSKVADYILKNKDVFDLAGDHIDKLGADLKIPSDMVFAAFKNGTLSMSKFYRLQSHIIYASHHSHWKSIVETAGDLLSHELMTELEALHGGELEDAKVLQSLGITKTGPEGIRQFIDTMRSLKSRLLNPDREILGLAVDNDVLQDLMRQCYRSDEGSYSHHNFPQAVQRAYEHFDEYLPKEGFVDSEVYKIHSANAKNTATKQTFDEDVVLRYQRLKGLLEAACEHIQGMSKGEVPYGGIFATMTDHIDSKAEQLAVRREELAQNSQQLKSTAGLEVQIDRLQDVLAKGVDSLEDLEDNFLVLAKDNKLADDIMTVLFARLMRFDQSLPPDERKKHYLAIQKKVASLAATPTTKSLSTMIKLVEGLQGASKQNFQRSEVREKFAKLTSANSLSIALDKLDKRKNIGMVFQPSRGLLLEVSGQLADACWENRYNCIADEFPNITSVTIRRNPGGKNDRLVGSFILIETHDAKTKEPVLVIRGLNPIENFINSVDVDDFFDTVFDYTGKTADRIGAKLGIAIAGYSGSFGTNRPTVQDFVDKIKDGLTKVRVPGKGTNFNGYNIEDDVYLVPR